VAGLTRQVDATPRLIAGTGLHPEGGFGGFGGSTAVLALGWGSGFSDVQGSSVAIFLANQNVVGGFIWFKNARDTLFLHT